MTFAVWVSAFGYFVDLYDLLLFSIVRVESLRSLGVPQDQLMPTGVLLINLQMTGLLLGGWFWGLMGDRYGRKSVLLGSILLYSVANFLNAFVHDISVYGVLRFVAGFGLAGELGAAITLIAESLPVSRRTYGAMIIAGIGLLGAVAAGMAAETFTWRQCYALGGVMGLLLLIGRKSVSESPLFKKQDRPSRFVNQIQKLLFDRTRLFTYLKCVAVGIPLWYTSGLLITFAPEFSQVLGVVGEVKAGRGILVCYGLASFGDVAAGLISQRWKSRRKTIAVFMLGTWASSAMFLLVPGLTASQVYGLFGLMGIAGGYWATYVLYASEQFGTNLRATVTISIPNMVRGAVVLMTTAFQSLVHGMGVVNSALVIGGVVATLAYNSLFGLRETFTRDLDFTD